MVRFKNRYLLCEIVFDNPRHRQCIEERAIMTTVRDVLARIHGDYGVGCCTVSLAVKYLNAYTGIVLLRCRREFYQMLWSIIPFITTIESKHQRYPCIFHTLHVGATIRTCQKFLIQYNRRQLMLLLRNCSTEEERVSVTREVQSCSLKELEKDQSEEEDDYMDTDSD